MEKNLYNTLPIDNVGPVTKNRFRCELLWGLEQIYKLYLSGSKFVVIFDNRCDIEIIEEDKISFYQLKTSEDNFNISKLVKQTKAQKDSIISKLYSLYKENLVKGLYIVSNRRLDTSQKKVSNKKILNFEELEIKEKDLIKKNIKKNRHVDADLKVVFYLQSPMCIKEPQTLLLGETVNFLAKKFKNEEMEPKKLFNLMNSLIENKSGYEYYCDDLDDAIKNKGITFDDFDEIIQDYKNTKREKIEDYNKLLEDFPFFDKIDIERAYNDLNLLHPSDMILGEVANIIEKISLEKNKLGESMIAIVNNLLHCYTFSFNYTNSEKQAIILYGLLKYKEKENG